MAPSRHSMNAKTISPAGLSELQKYHFTVLGVAFVPGTDSGDDNG